jgi:hypothetical protein
MSPRGMFLRPFWSAMKPLSPRGLFLCPFSILECRRGSATGTQNRCLERACYSKTKQRAACDEQLQSN